MKHFDNYEVHGVADFGRGRNRHSEQVADDKAQYWSLFGHIPGQGLECIGDFKTRQQAEDILARITGAHASRSEPTREGLKILPPDPEGMNGRRSMWAAHALSTFQTVTRTEIEDSLSDLLADLMHWADRHDFDFNHELQRGLSHYEAETAGGEQ
jgi:hypothetical protein